MARQYAIVAHREPPATASGETTLGQARVRQCHLVGGPAILSTAVQLSGGRLVQ